MIELKNAETEALRARWQSPETELTLQRHMELYVRYGILQAYVACADGSYPPGYIKGDTDGHYAKLQALISRLARAETYLAATVVGSNHYGLEHVNNDTGFAISAGSVDTLMPVCRPRLGSEEIKPVEPYYTVQQADIVMENAHELAAMGLHRPLYPFDVKGWEY